jgi:hypothetical protein
MIDGVVTIRSAQAQGLLPATMEGRGIHGAVRTGGKEGRRGGWMDDG